MLGDSWVVVQPAAFQEGLSSMALVTWLVGRRAVSQSVTMFTRTRCCPLSVLDESSLRLGLPDGLFRSDQSCVFVSHLFHAFYMFHPYHPPWLDHWHCMVKTTNYEAPHNAIMQFSSPSFHPYVCLRPLFSDTFNLFNTFLRKRGRLPSGGITSHNKILSIVTIVRTWNPTTLIYVPLGREAECNTGTKQRLGDLVHSCCSHLEHRAAWNASFHFSFLI
jgi:hypothetical protein